MPLASAQGCLLGLFVGDAVGAPLEFLRDGEHVEARIQRALRLSGGGSLNVAPGQVTDDSELAIHLLRGLLGHCPKMGFPSDDVAREYLIWRRSEPFDVGATINRAFVFAEDAAGLIRNAKRFNLHSQANGALMRVAPLAIWAHTVDDLTLVQMARQDAQLSHPHRVCLDASAVFCVTLSALITARDSASLQERSSAGIQRASALMTSGDMHADIREWFACSGVCSLDDIVCFPQIGHVKHAFILAFFFLRHCTPFDVALTETCRKLGDTDTNCAIVGAMMGALHGISGIPQDLSAPVLSFDCWSHDPKVNLLGYTRPATYRIREVMKLVPVLGVDASLTQHDTPCL